MNCSSFLIWLFYPDRWPASDEARRWPNVWLICLTSHLPCCFPWLPRFNLCVNIYIYNFSVYSLSFNLVKDQLFFKLFSSSVIAQSFLFRLQMEILKFVSKLPSWFNIEFELCLVNFGFSKIRPDIMIISKKKKENLANYGLCCPGWPHSKIERKWKER